MVPVGIQPTLRALIACTAPMLWMFSVFEGEFVKANNAGSRKNQSFEIPIRLIVLEIFNLRACQCGRENMPIRLSGSTHPRTGTTELN